ncbi:MAG: hypothetical protein HUK26_03230, partial [Duodenibacillus sp.]|nr:hypothetical protein [Duodenibacillus sp.]
FAEEPDTLSLAKTLEGEIYGLPKFQGKWPDCNGVMFINKTWLDKLGLEVPTTLSQLRDVLIAFRDNDCNGNGDPNDEVPMDFNGWFGAAYSLSNLIGSWGIQLVNWAYDGYFAEDGIIKNFAVDERSGLLVLQRYFDESVEPDAFVDDIANLVGAARSCREDVDNWRNEEEPLQGGVFV